jgi:hypothetical protein
VHLRDEILVRETCQIDVVEIAHVSPL